MVESILSLEILVKAYSVDYVSSNPYALIQKIVSLQFVTKETLYTVWHHINRTSYQNCSLSVV